jgi:hypothetical protein
MQLDAGKYQTRNSRNVELFEKFTREKRIDAHTTKSVTVWKGRLYYANGVVDSVQEWEETNTPNMIAAFVSVGRAEGVASEFDLVYKYPAAA